MWILISSVLDPLQTKCQLARAQGLEARARSRGSPAAAVFVPACSPEGHFMPIQCHNQTGYCWCSTPDGKPVSGTTALHVIPNCTGQLCFIQSITDCWQKPPKQNNLTVKDFKIAFFYVIKMLF